VPQEIKGSRYAATHEDCCTLLSIAGRYAASATSANLRAKTERTRVLQRCLNMPSSTISLRTFRVGTPRKPGEGLRVGTVRFLPRGVKIEDYARLNYFDVWFPLLSPSSELLKWMKSRDWPSEQVRWSKFKERYTAEMKKTDARQAIKLLAELALATPLSIGCYCENESACHRSILRELIELAADR
jgi:uncharacterized protein YeaO (DUF488 family)